MNSLKWFIAVIIFSPFSRLLLGIFLGVPIGLTVEGVIGCLLFLSGLPEVTMIIINKFKKKQV